jgi:serine/threonine protein phosphatase PrpC
MNLTTSTFIERGNPELQDRLEVFRFGNRVVLIVADGSGGRSGAAEAAEFVIRSTRNIAASLTDATACFRLLLELEQKIAQATECGETTGVILGVSPDEIFGANVGDSAVWLFTPSDKEELSRVRKPYLGTGVASPHQFARKSTEATLVVASDGLWKYTSLELIEQKVRTENPTRLAESLGNLVRLRSGSMPDDVAIATCRSCL